jgi:outer membrane protein OmpA-like peptidoglycan-associated protein
MKLSWAINAAAMAILLVALGLTVKGEVKEAAHRPETGAAAEAPKKGVVLMANAEDAYCTDNLKTVLKRVLTSCGLIGGGRAGCKPNELKNVAAISGEDFNALFKPLTKRGGMIQFDPKKDELDPAAKALIEKLWMEQKGAMYFFVVARASPDGPTEENQVISHKRGNSVQFYLQERFKDPDLEKKLGLLWLGEEYAQLGEEFCEWQSNRPDTCAEKDKPEKKVHDEIAKRLNRSAILSWIDCRL